MTIGLYRVMQSRPAQAYLQPLRRRTSVHWLQPFFVEMEGDQMKQPELAPTLASIYAKWT